MAAIFLAWVMRGVVPDRWLVAWVAIIFAVKAARYIFVRGHQTDPGSESFTVAWYTAGIFISAVVWGTVGVLFFPSEAVYHQVFLAFVLGGMAAGAVASYAAWLPAFYAFAVPVLTPIAIRFFWEGNEMSVVMGGLLFVYGVALAVLAHNVNRVMKKSLLLQSALVESEERLCTIFDNVPAAIFLKDAEGRYKFINARYAEWFEIDPATVDGRTVHDMFPAERADRYRAGDNRILKTLSTVSEEVEIPLPSGETRTFALTKFPIMNGRELTDIGGVMIDITERRTAEIAMREKTGILEATMKTIPDGLQVLDRDMNLVAWNDQLFTVLDLDKKKSWKQTIQVRRFDTRWRTAVLTDLGIATNWLPHARI